MENTKTPQAYPTLFYDQTTGETNGHDAGMTLRDHFTGLAMQTYIQDHLQHKRENKNGWTVDFITETAYVFADAMLQKRESI